MRVWAGCVEGGDGEGWMRGGEICGRDGVRRGGRKEGRGRGEERRLRDGGRLSRC